VEHGITGPESIHQCSPEAVAEGRIVGSSDAIGGDVADTPISPKDMQATAYHLLGFPEDATIPDPQGRPLRIAGSGQIRPELLR